MKIWFDKKHYEENQHARVNIYIHTSKILMKTKNYIKALITLNCGK